MTDRTDNGFLDEDFAVARLAAIVESSFDAIISKDLSSVITTWNQAAEHLFGYSAQEAVGQSIVMLIPEERRSEEDEIIARVRAGHKVDSFETVRRRKDGKLINVSITVSPIKDSRGRIVGASKIARDITAAKESERRIRVLMREVNHRVKNQFAVLLAMVRETGRRTSDPVEFEARIRERIVALAKSHDLLVDSEWSGAPLISVVKEHLEPFPHDGKITMSGPNLFLESNAVQNIGMAVHELGTNSTKYGALSQDNGKIVVSWEVVRAPAGEQEFKLVWDESSASGAAQPVETDERKGFGSVILLRVTPGALGGKSTLDHRLGRVVWTLTAPLANILATPSF